MEKSLEIVDGKDIKYPRLTVTPTRITIKFPLHTSEEEKVQLKKLFLEVAEDLKEYPFAMRGSLKPDRWLRMEGNDRSSHHKTYLNKYAKTVLPPS